MNTENAEIEVWKIIEKYQNYEVSTLGRVRNINSGKFLTPTKCKNHYQTPKVGIMGEYVRVKKLVADAFLPKEEGKRFISFLNKNGSDVKLSNLIRTERAGVNRKNPPRKYTDFKFCKGCNSFCSRHFFRVRKKGELSDVCIECLSKKHKQWAEKNKDHIKQYSKEYWDNLSPEKKLAEKIRLKKYREENLEYIKNRDRECYLKNIDRRKQVSKEYIRKNLKNIYIKRKIKMESDPQYNLSVRVRSRISTKLKQHLANKSCGSVELLGCSFGFYVKYLQRKFDKNMSWDNYGKYWQIDHILPLSRFNLTDVSQQKIAFHYTNTQPLEKITNMSKGNKIIQPQIKLPL